MNDDYIDEDDGDTVNADSQRWEEAGQESARQEAADRHAREMSAAAERSTQAWLAQMEADRIAREEADRRARAAEQQWPRGWHHV